MIYDVNSPLFRSFLSQKGGSSDKRKMEEQKLKEQRPKANGKIVVDVSKYYYNGFSCLRWNELVLIWLSSFSISVFQNSEINALKPDQTQKENNNIHIGPLGGAILRSKGCMYGNGMHLSAFPSHVHPIQAPNSLQSPPLSPTLNSLHLTRV
ncbi:hypothetical protein CRYUN_Cryun14cG0132900 [Craigia yunnanensis]